MSVGRWLVRHAHGYANLSRKERTAIRDFPVLWAIFELKATSPATANPANIKAAVGRIGHLPAIDRTLSEAVAYYSQRYYRHGHPTRHLHSLQLKVNDEAIVRNVLTYGLTDTRSTLIALLLIVNRLRNNYLHGTKAGYGFEDQLGNFTHANRILMKLIPYWP